jgi:hypothetical protein
VLKWNDCLTQWYDWPGIELGRLSEVKSLNKQLHHLRVKCDQLTVNSEQCRVMIQKSRLRVLVIFYFHTLKVRDSFKFIIIIIVVVVLISGKERLPRTIAVQFWCLCYIEQINSPHGELCLHKAYSMLSVLLAVYQIDTENMIVQCRRFKRKTYKCFHLTSLH